MQLRFGVILFNYSISEMVKKSIILEKSGFDTVWVSDVLFEGGPELILPDLFPAMTAIGLSTKKINLGTAVIDALSRHPSKIATTTATIDNMLDGRTIFGMGGGEIINHEPFGISTTDVYRKLRETVQILKLLWTADHTNPASYNGKYFRLKEAYIKIKPKRKPHPPIYLPAFGPKMLEMTGELADGWIVQNHTPETYLKFLFGPIKKAAFKAGRSIEDIDTANVFVVSLSDDRDEAAKTTLEIKNWMVWSPDILKIIAPEIKHPGKRQPFIKSRAKIDVRNQERIAKEIPDEVALQATIWGTPDDCIQQLEKFIQSGLRHPILFFIPTSTDSVDQMVKKFSSKVIPYFKSQDSK